MSANTPVIGDDGADGMRTRQTRADLKRKRSSFIDGGTRGTRAGKDFTPKIKIQKEPGDDKGLVFS